MLYAPRTTLSIVAVAVQTAIGAAWRKRSGPFRRYTKAQPA
jgi:hypothetical protein